MVDAATASGAAVQATAAAPSPPPPPPPPPPPSRATAIAADLLGSVGRDTLADTLAMPPLKLPDDTPPQDWKAAQRAAASAAATPQSTAVGEVALGGMSELDAMRLRLEWCASPHPPSGCTLRLAHTSRPTTRPSSVTG